MEKLKITKKNLMSSRLIVRIKGRKAMWFQKEDLTLDNFYNEHLEKIREAQYPQNQKEVESQHSLVVKYHRMLQSSDICLQPDGLEKRRMCRYIYFRMCDSVFSLLEMEPSEHYQSNLIMAAIDACEPQSPNFLDASIIIPFLALYNVDTMDLASQCKQAKILMKRSKKKMNSMQCAMTVVKSARLWKVVEVMELAMTFPSTMFDLKRSISCLKIITNITDDPQKDHLHNEQDYDHYGLENIKPSVLYLDQLPNGLFLKCHEYNTVMYKLFKTFKLKKNNKNISNDKSDPYSKIPIDIRHWIFDTVISKYTSVK